MWHRKSVVSGISSGTLPFCSIIILIITILIITIVRATSTIINYRFNQSAAWRLVFSLWCPFSMGLCCHWIFFAVLHTQKWGKFFCDVTALNKKERRLWVVKGKNYSSVWFSVIQYMTITSLKCQTKKWILKALVLHLYFGFLHLALRETWTDNCNIFIYVLYHNRKYKKLWYYVRLKIIRNTVKSDSLSIAHFHSKTYLIALTI